jgi:hypothetical protein
MWSNLKCNPFKMYKTIYVRVESIFFNKCPFNFIHKS